MCVKYALPVEEIMSYENKLYKDTVTLIMDSYAHRYTWEEKDLVVKSVTTALKVIAKPQLISWAANIGVEAIAELIQPGVEYDEVQLAEIWQIGKEAHRKKKVNAADLGTLIHKWIEDYIKGNNPGMPKNKKMKRSVNMFLKWVEEHNVKFVLSEQVALSRTYLYAGTIDFICKIDGDLYIGDLKTSKGIYAEMLMQTAAYRFAREEEFPKEKYRGQIILRIGSDGTFDTAVVRSDKSYKMLLEGFLYALYLSNSMEKIEAYKPERKI